jgi:sterol desaturase/sphingolipid hydroxylase (fatty acid hydroxylase superfamily)
VNIEATASFYESVLGAGAILSGFCGTFLSFRIQREALYYRQPALSYELGDAKDVFVGRTHFTSAFLPLVLGTLCSVIFGFLLPLFGIAGLSWAPREARVVVGGLTAALVLIAAYFFDELVHYRILSGRLLNDASEWRGEAIIVVAGVMGAVVAYLAVRCAT